MVDRHIRKIRAFTSGEKLTKALKVRDRLRVIRGVLRLGDEQHRKREHVAAAPERRGQWAQEIDRRARHLENWMIRTRQKATVRGQGKSHDVGVDDETMSVNFRIERDAFW